MTTREFPLTSFLAIRPRWLVATLHPRGVPAVKDLVYNDVAAATFFAALELARVPTRQISRTLHTNDRNLITLVPMFGECIALLLESRSTVTSVPSLLPSGCTRQQQGQRDTGLRLHGHTAGVS
jgi:hypothetical protein